MTQNKSFIQSILNKIEYVGNKLPHPATLFALLALIVVILSAIASSLGFSTTNPTNGQSIIVNNLLSADGLRWLYENVEHNFISFPPLALVLVIMLGIGVADGSGLFTTLVRQLVLGAPKKFITAAIITAGIFSHLASEVGYVVLIPLGAIIFHALGRHPMAGFAAAFCGVSAGFGSNFLIGSVDPILAGLSTSAAQIIDPTMVINPMVNYYFMVASSIMIVIVGTLITEKIIEPRLGSYTGSEQPLKVEPLNKEERKGMLWAGLGILVLSILIVITLLPNGLLRDPQTDGILKSPFFNGIIVAFTLIFFVPGILYGIAVNKIKSDKDVVRQMTQSMKEMGGYIVLVFFAAQFVAIFKHSNLGIIVAIEGAIGLKAINLTGLPLILSFTLLAAFINLFMGSASAKWAIMAPVFIPMFMLLDYHPGVTQAAFRVGDSVTNVITPMMSYFALIVTYSQKYDQKYGIGTIISLMIPYTFILLIVWMVLISIWYYFGFPLGLDGPIHL